MQIEDIIEKVRKENQQANEGERNVHWNNCVDYICDKLKVGLDDNMTKFGFNLNPNDFPDNDDEVREQ